MQDPSGSGHRILLVDEDESLRALATESLSGAGFAVETARNGLEALGWAIAAPFDLIVTDLSLPRIDGVELVDRLRESAVQSGTKLIALFDRSGGESPHHSADALVDKPLDPGHLIAEARRLIGARDAAGSPGGTRSREETSVDETIAVRRADLETFAPTEAQVAGRFGALRLTEVIRVLHTGRRTGALELEREDGRAHGTLVLRDGELVAARAQEEGAPVVTGETALDGILDWPSGSYRLRVGAISGALEVERNIDRATTHIIEGVEAPGLLTPPTLLGPFELERTVSRGAHVTVATVRRAGSPRSGRTRLLVDDRALREEAELSRLSRLHARGVARLLSWGPLPDGRVYYETELTRGPTLEELVETRGPIERGRALGLFEAILESLGQIHAAGLAHGGLDARRVVFPSGERPLLLDCGITRRGGGPDETASVRATAPEVWKGRRPGPPADLYAVGVLLFHALTGRYPFDDADPLAVCHKHLRAEAPSLARSGLADPGPALEAVVARLLAKEPSGRFADAEAACLALGSARLVERARLAPGLDDGVPPPSGYRFTRMLGEGGAGRVYEATHETLEKVVAVKVLRPDWAATDEGRRRFLREGRIAASLLHPGIVQVFDAREEHGRLYLVMEFVEGETLSARLAREGAFDEAEALSTARQVLEALGAAHDRGIIHRDVKPDNLLLTPLGRVKVVDFGLARSTSLPAQITQQGLILGTPYYMSPEQCRCGPLDRQSDLYSFGATLYHVLSGRPPFTGASAVDVMSQHLDATPLPLSTVAPGVSSAFARVVERLLRKEPAERFSSAREVLEALPPAPSRAVAFA